VYLANIQSSYGIVYIAVIEESYGGRKLGIITASIQPLTHAGHQSEDNHCETNSGTPGGPPWVTALAAPTVENPPSGTQAGGPLLGNPPWRTPLGTNLVAQAHGGHRLKKPHGGPEVGVPLWDPICRQILGPLCEPPLKYPHAGRPGDPRSGRTCGPAWGARLSDPIWGAPFGIPLGRYP
jgi:hypothetical protein